MSGEIQMHPSRYPKHPGTKGQVWAGECNTTACPNGEAFHFNNQTLGYYCRGCARGINRHAGAIPICTSVDGPLTVEQMDALQKADWKVRFGASS